ncbi:restriction endonuclease subunit S [Streptomyces sp. sk226]|uniref:restriction endonuclease subunit S n=1 Tax=Streptomyces sp. sk226 TaxID=2034268 RepID=UPI000BF19DE3|nr:restriction endonuclease subunit S [Streptomyces sp. sk226]
MSDSLVSPLGVPMPDGWQLRSIGELCVKIGSGATPKGGAAVYTAAGTNFIRSQNVFDHYFSSAGLAHIDDLAAEKLSGVAVRERDVLLNITGDGETIARCCVAPQWIIPARVNQHVMILRVSDALSPDYLQRYLSQPAMRVHMLNHNSGGSRRALTKAQVAGFKIAVPALKEQEYIAAALGALDEKITINGRIATTADHLSADIFRHATLTSSTHFTEHALSATAEFINGRAFTKDATGTGRMVVRIAEINNGPGSSTVYNDIDVPEKHLARPGDVLFSWSGSLMVTRWFRPEAIINQHIFKCVPKNSFPRWLVSQLVHRKIDEFRAIAASKATTMGHIQRKHLDEPVLVPTREVLSSLDARIAPLWERALLAERENLALAALRDTLLPQLMSGRLRVRDAEKIVEDHV